MLNHLERLSELKRELDENGPDAVRSVLRGLLDDMIEQAKRELDLFDDPRSN